MSDTNDCPEAFVALAERLAERAREITSRYFRSALTVEDKPDRTPVTVADRETETALRALIAEAFPAHGMIGEEHGAERADADHVWVLDPIDGTKRFATGHAQFGTLIALLREGRPILGIIDMPELNERWVGAAGRPTLHHDRRGTRVAHCRACPGPERAAFYTTAPEMFEGPDEAAFARVRDATRMILYGGECYAYGLLASGHADLVIEADMDAYDFLSHVPVVEGAGGVISDWRGAPLGLETDGRTLAAATPELHEKVLELLAQT